MKILVRLTVLCVLITVSACKKKYICECSSKKAGIFETNQWKDKDGLGYDWFKRNCDATAASRSISRSDSVTCILK